MASRRFRRARTALGAVALTLFGVLVGSFLLPVGPGGLGGERTAGPVAEAQDPGEDESETGVSRTPENVRFVPGTLLVKFVEGTPEAVREAVLARAGATAKRKIARIRVEAVAVARGREDHALAALKASPHVAYVERDVHVEKLATTPNDPLWSTQWGLVNVLAPEGWDRSRGSSTVVVAILDTGVDAGHADLTGALVAGHDFINNDSDASDDNGHGTAAAGMAAARTNNREGIAGMCWACSLMPVKVLDAKGSGTTSTLAAGIIFSADRGARVINMSLGGPGTTQTLTDAVTYASNRGSILVAAAGNSGTSTPSYPAAYPDVLAVAASTSANALYSWSNYGSWVQVAAPGCNRALALGGGYADFCGTSSAAPLVAGLVGLAVSLRPDVTRAEVDEAIRRAASAVSGSVQYGRINTDGTLAALGAPGSLAATPPDVSALPTISGAPRVGEIVTASNGSWSGSAPMAFSYQWLRCRPGSDCAAIAGATAQSYALTAGDENATLRVRVTAANAGGSSAATSNETGVVLLPPPANVALPAIAGTARVGEALTAHPGEWTNAPTRFRHQWLRCDTSGASCAPINGANGQTLTLTSSERGSTIRVVVEAANAGGAATATSRATSTVVAIATVRVTFKGTLSASRPSRSHKRTIGAGRTRMSLSFTRTRSLTLSVFNAKSVRVARISGGSPLRVARTLRRGTYRFGVHSPRTSARYTLTVSYPPP